MIRYKLIYTVPNIVEIEVSAKNLTNATKLARKMTFTELRARTSSDSRVGPPELLGVVQLEKETKRKPKTKKQNKKPKATQRVA